MSADPTAVRFPEENRPENSRLLVRNELQIDAPPERVWAWLTRPDLWPSYYRNARLVRHLEGPWPKIQLGSRWRWFTFGARIVSELVDCEPHTRLAWDAKGLGARGYHGWVLEPCHGGTNVVTEETQRGWGIAAVKPVLRPRMLREHQRWLEGLAQVAPAAPPTVPSP